MDIEVLLFLVVGGLSVFAAVMMLLDTNAVQSALFLVLNFACVAFLYLMLDASFLAMVQIAVYAGAIMVLFLFVIMLLGAEKAMGAFRQFKWVAPAALVLAFSFMFAVGAAVLQGNVEDRELPPADPMFRIAYSAPEFLPEVDVFLNGELAFDAVSFRDYTDYTEVAPGDYQVSFGRPGGDATTAIPAGSVTLASDTVSTLVVYNAGSSAPVIASVIEDLSHIDGDEGRVTVFNAYNGVEALSVVDPGSDYLFADLEDAQNAPVLLEGLPFGEASAVTLFGDGDFRAAVVPSTEGDLDDIIVRLRDVEIEAETSTLIVLTEGVEDEGVTPVVTNVAVTDTAPEFGGPEAIGQELFVRYVLAFEMVAMLLLAAMVGAIVITQRADIKPKPGRPTRRKVSRPLTSVISSQTGHDVSEERAIEQPEQPEPAGD